MAENMGKWPSNRGPISIIMPSDGGKGDTAPLALGLWYDFHEVGGHLGNVGLTALPTCPTRWDHLTSPYMLASYPST